MTKTAIVIGAGWAGCAAAVELAEKGFSVTLLEQSARLGGRASSFIETKTGCTLDNGQHLFMGCYSGTIHFLKKIGTLSKLKFQKQLSVNFVNREARIFSLQCLPLPAPLHLFSGLLGLGTLSFSEKLAMAKVYQAIKRWSTLPSPSPNGRGRKGEGQNNVLTNLTVEEWLIKCRQSERSRRYFWDLITLATLNEQPSIACAESLAVVLSQAFFADKAKSQIAISTVGLSELLEPACEEFLRTRNGKILKNHLVTKILIRDEQVEGILLRDGTKLTADFYISALPFHLVGGLLGEAVMRTDFFSKIKMLKSSPIFSISLWFDCPVTDHQFLGMLDTQVQWLFNKGKILQTDPENRYHSSASSSLPFHWEVSGANEAGSPPTKVGGYLSLVISGAHNYLEKSDEEILKICIQELHQCFPESKKAKLLHSRILREKNATLSPQVGSSSCRLPQKTPIRNFFLCGDWTDTGFPATIESAVVSGIKASEQILAGL